MNHVSFVGHTYVVSGDVELTGTPSSGAPAENTCIAKTDAMWKAYGCVVDTPTATTVSGG